MRCMLSLVYPAAHLLPAWLYHSPCRVLSLLHLLVFLPLLLCYPPATSCAATPLFCASLRSCPPARLTAAASAAAASPAASAAAAARCSDYTTAAIPWGEPDLSQVQAMLPSGAEGSSNVLSVSFDRMTYPVTVDGIHTVRGLAARGGGGKWTFDSSAPGGRFWRAGMSSANLLLLPLLSPRCCRSAAAAAGVAPAAPCTTVLLSCIAPQH